METSGRCGPGIIKIESSQREEFSAQKFPLIFTETYRVPPSDAQRALTRGYTLLAKRVSIAPRRRHVQKFLRGNFC